jgi:hypothetical protein
MRRKVGKELSRAPRGDLLVTSSHGYTSYRYVSRENGRRVQTCIGKNRGLIYALAHKRYLQEKLRRLDLNIRALEKALKEGCSLEDEEIVAALPDAFRELDRKAVILGRTDHRRDWPKPVRENAFPREYLLSVDPEKIFDWASAPYAENTSFAESKKHLSQAGVLCRSKSEAAILGIYDSLAIPYHYDETIVINGALFSPDIIGCRPDGRLVYHEHYGLDTPSYRQRAEFKERIYRDAGIVRGRNLLTTYDRGDGTVNLELIRMQIEDAYRTEA